VSSVDTQPAPRGRRRFAPWLLLTPNLLWLAIFLAGPLVLLGIISLHRYQSGRGIIETYDLENYTRFLTDPFYREVLWSTLLLGVYVTVVALVLAFPVAYALSRSRGFVRTLLYFCVLLPLLTSAVVRTFGWMILLGNNGFINRSLITMGIIEDPLRLMYSLPGVVIALTEVLMPFMVLALDAALLNVAPQIYEAARNLGAGRTRIFFRITLPLSMPGIVSGSVLVFTLAISAFVTPSLIGGPRIKVMPTMIYQQALFLLNWPFGAAIAFVMLFAILALLMGAMKLSDRPAGR
jgi:putative spermidine/putrescine transport system permease protein